MNHLNLTIPEPYRDCLRLGTCSWKCDSWKGLIYRPDLDYGPNDYLPDYARHLNTVEVDQWFWSLFPPGAKLPDQDTVRAYAEGVPDDFLFTVKAPNSITLTHFYSRQPKPTGNNGRGVCHHVRCGYESATAGVAPRKNRCADGNCLGEGARAPQPRKPTCTPVLRQHRTSGWPGCQGRCACGMTDRETRPTGLAAGDHCGRPRSGPVLTVSERAKCGTPRRPVHKDAP